MVEWVGVVVTAIGILLERISAKEKKLEQRIDVKDALMDLLHLVRAWERLAERTNQLLLEWISKEKTEDELSYREQLREASMGQGLLAADVASHMGLSEDYFAYSNQPSTPSERSTLADLFHVYAPDLESDVRRVLDIRLTQLQILIEGLDQGGVSDIQQAVRALAPENLVYPSVGDPAFTEQIELIRAQWKLNIASATWATYDRDAQELASAYEHSARLLNELSKTLASYIRETWDLKEQTLGK